MIVCHESVSCFIRPLAEQGGERSPGVKGRVTKTSQISAWHFDTSFDLAELAFAVMHQPRQAGESKAGVETPSSKILSKPDALVNHVYLRNHPSGQPGVTIDKNVLGMPHRQGEFRCFPFPLIKTIGRRRVCRQPAR
jgi:hypothetical protein